MDIRIPYYEDMSRISNSNIGWFLKKGPRYLKDMLEGKAEGIKGSFLEKGTMIHEYILQREEFHKHYFVCDYAIPRSPQQKLFCEEYAKMDLIVDDPHLEKAKAYRKAYKADKLSDEKCIELAEEIILCYLDYIDYLTMKDTKKIISYADLNMLHTIEKNLKSHKKANELLYTYPDTFDVYNEFHINWEFPNASNLGDMACKSLLDRLMIDHVNKKIILVDLKTTADVYNFKHSVDEYDYSRQLSYYWMAIHWYFKNELKIDASEMEEYEFETYIIAIQSHTGNEVKVFRFTPEVIESKIPIISNALKEINWHMTENKWDHVKSYYEGDGTEEIC